MVLTAEQNRRLTEVGPGTPMGNLLRRYWHPIAAESEFAGVPGAATKAVRQSLAVSRPKLRFSASTPAKA